MNIQSYLSKAIWKIRFLLNQITLSPFYFQLIKSKKNQKIKFQNLKKKCSKYYKNLSSQDVSYFLTPLWENYNKKLEKIILPYPKFSFLRTKIIRETMFVVAGGEWIETQLSFLEKSISKEKLTEILEEDYVGNPILINSTYLTSHNSIHHLYHLIQFQEKTKTKLEEISTIIEWGGGYGNMAKLFKRIVPEATYIIIDLAPMVCLQWVYLATIFEEDTVNLIGDMGTKLKHGKINLLPLCFLKNYQLSANLFISTWSLSESSKSAQDYVDSHNFFDAKHLLLGYQKSGPALPYAGQTGEMAKKRGAIIYPIEFLPGNYYAFK